jgi:hypothetical protein
MGAEPPYIYHKASTNSFIAPSDRGFTPKTGTPAPCTPTGLRPKSETPGAKDAAGNQQPESYFVV